MWKSFCRMGRKVQSLPGFIIIGAMKGGTSSLYHYIASHPHIIASSPKETNFFLSDNNFNKGVNWYRALFQGCGDYAFEASPNYTKRHMFPGVPGRMHSVLPDIKLIYVLRDPMERMISHYVHNYAHGRESRSFPEAMCDIGSNYVQTSKYYFQIKAFLEYYSDTQLLIIESEQLHRNAAKVLADIFGFLGIPVDFDVNVLKKRFHESSRKRRSPKLIYTLRQKISGPHLLKDLMKLTKSFGKSIERPALTPSDRTRIAEAIAPDIERLRKFTGLEFSDWSV